MPKSKNIIDSFMSGLIQNAKNAVDSVTIKDQDQIRIRSESEQDQNRITKGADKEQIRSRYVSDKEQIKISPKEHQRSTTEKKIKRSTKGAPLYSLSKSQTMIFLWFKQRGQTGLFNKPEIAQSLSIPYITIRKAIKKLETIGVLDLKYDNVQKIYSYRVLNENSIKLSKKIEIISGSYQDHSKIISPSLISSSSFINKTTTIPNHISNTDTEKIITKIMHTDPEYTYWNEQQVTPKQINIWKKEFGLDLQSILNNLCYVRWQIINQKIEIKKSAADYLYGVMRKNGGTINKPAGYKTMNQLDIDFFETWKKQRVEHTQRIERIKDDAVKAEIEPKIKDILAKPDLENTYIQEALENIKTKKRLNFILSVIKSGKKLDEKSYAILSGYLEKILTKEALRNSYIERDR